VELARRLSIFGRNADMLATVCGSFRDRFNYGSRTVANHAQGREIWFSKEQLQLPRTSAHSLFFTSEISKNIFAIFQPALAFLLSEASN